MQEEARAIELVRAGEVDAFADVVKIYQAPIIRYLYRLTGNYDLARDLAQDTFVQAYQGILKTDAELSFKAWLYRIATNNAYQHHRRRKLIQFIPFVPGKHDRPMSSNQLGEPEEAVAIREALLQLPEAQRTCLVLHCVEGFTYREIAATVGCSEEAVRKRVTRGKLEFRRLYGGGDV